MWTPTTHQSFGEARTCIAGLLSVRLVCMHMHTRRCQVDNTPLCFWQVRCLPSSVHLGVSHASDFCLGCFAEVNVKRRRVFPFLSYDRGTLQGAPATTTSKVFERVIADDWCSCVATARCSTSVSQALRILIRHSPVGLCSASSERVFWRRRRCVYIAEQVLGLLVVVATRGLCVS